MFNAACSELGRMDPDPEPVLLKEKFHFSVLYQCVKTIIESDI